MPTAEPCRRCVDCEGQEHHFGDAYIGTAEDEPEHPAAGAGHAAWYGCKHCPAWVLDLDDDDGPCWCGEANPLYDEDGLDDGCGGIRVLYCHCGGDLCVCHHHGGIECPGCDDCDDEVAFADGELDDLDDDMVEEDDDDADEV